MMTRQERFLRKAVVLLAAAIVLLVAILVVVIGINGLSAGKPGFPGSDKAVGYIAGETITAERWLEDLTEKHGYEMLVAMMNRIAVENEANAREISISGERLDRELKRISQGYGSEAEYYKQMQTEFGMSREDVREETEYQLLLQAVATADVVIDEEELAVYIEENKDRLIPSKKMELSMIKVDSYEEADEIMDRLDDGEDFGDLLELSVDQESKRHGGSIGIVEENDPFWPEMLLKTAAGLTPGDIAGPLAADDGYAVIRLESVTSPRVPPEDEIREQALLELALSRAVPLNEVERRLREKYGAEMVIPGHGTR